MNEMMRLSQVKSLCSRGIFCVVLLVVRFYSSYSSRRRAEHGGRVRGTVTDASGSAVAGATVTLVNVATNVSREATRGPRENIIFLEVPVGTYEIDVNQTGFKKFVRKDIVVDLNAVVGWISR